MNTRLALVCAGVLLFAGALGAAQPAAPQPPPPKPRPQAQPEAQPAAPPQPPPQTSAVAAPPDAAQLLIFGSEMGIVINPIKADKTADFERVMARIREALQNSTNPVRQQQGASWKMLKAAEPGPAGSVLYVFVLDPPVKNADYTVSRILAEGYPLEVDALWTTLRDAYAAPMHRLTLDTVQPAPATPPPPPARP